MLLCFVFVLVPVKLYRTVVVTVFLMFRLSPMCVEWGKTPSFSFPIGDFVCRL